MITKEHYQFIRQHPAFVNLPVELFDKLAVEIQYRKIPKGPTRAPFSLVSRLCSD